LEKTLMLGKIEGKMQEKGTTEEAQKVYKTTFYLFLYSLISRIME